MCVDWLKAGLELTLDFPPWFWTFYAVVGAVLLTTALTTTLVAVFTCGLVGYPIYMLVYDWLWGGILAPLWGFPATANAPGGAEYVTYPIASLMLGSVGGIIAYKVGEYYLRGFRFAPVIEPLWGVGAKRRDDLWDERQFVGLIAECDGVIGLGDVMTTYVWTRDHAFEEMTRLLVDYGGDVRVDEQGIRRG